MISEKRDYFLNLYHKIHNPMAYAIMVYLYMKSSENKLLITYRDLAEELEIAPRTLRAQINYLEQSCNLIDVASDKHTGTIIRLYKPGDSPEKRVEHFLNKIGTSALGKCQRYLWNGIFGLSLRENKVDFFEIERTEIDSICRTLLQSPVSLSLHKLNLKKDKIDAIKGAKSGLEKMKRFLSECNEFFVLFEGNLGESQKINFYKMKGEILGS